MTDVHLINHTHWDREWFLTQEYTTAWVPALIDSLLDRVAENPDYEYLFDGQTLCIEDLLRIRPDYEDKVRRLVGGGNVRIGPSYSQPDWRITSGELHVRNLQYGISDAHRFGGDADVAWLVDTFGHISQAPQMLAQCGVDAAYVWRGVPELHPVFRWQSPDGTELTTIDLFGGYRNLYGITHTPEIALHRLVAETDKLGESYDGLPVPLFDGYDLDCNPEDPARWYADAEVPERISLHASSPRAYADAIAEHAVTAPVLAGELLSGKYGSTFPGSLSTRTHLKVLHHDAEIAWHRKVEPLAVLARAAGHPVDLSELERASRTLLQNAVHDCICGVSVDQVHERMERSYNQLLSRANELQQEFASASMSGFASGTYAVSTHAMTTSSVTRVGESAVATTTTGIGIRHVSFVSPVTKLDQVVESAEWSNDHYTARIDAGGLVVDGVGRIARMVVRVDDGDTYSSEPGEILGELTMVGAPVRLDVSELDTTIRTEWSLCADGREVSATLDARFDSGPLIDLTITLDSTGVGFRVDAEFDTDVAAPTVHASMPFDVVERPHEDTDLFGTDIDPALAAILMGQRETGVITEYPFHDFVALSSDQATRAVIARGLRSCRSTADGTISVALRRSSEWLALTNLRFRAGDAGPAMYVPIARSERVVQHRIAFAALDGGLADSGLTALNEAFHNPPLIVEVAGGDDAATTEWSLLQAELPVTACLPSTDDNAAIVRLFNPHHTTSETAVAGSRTTLMGEPVAAEHIGPHEIVTFEVAVPDLPLPNSAVSVDVWTPIESRVGPNRSKPCPLELAALRARIAELDDGLVDTRAERASSNGGPEGYRLEHREYVLDRERLELMLSLELNQRLSDSDGEVSIPDEPDPVIADLGVDLNDLRIKRRIFDYVVQALANA